jgi:hypothetical protein
MLARSGIILLFISILAGCVSPGTIESRYDEFTGKTESTVYLGWTKIISSPIGLVHKVNISLLQEQAAESDYYFTVENYVESDGRGCINVSNGDKVIFLVSGQKYEKNIVHSVKHEKITGVLYPACKDIVKIGPLSSEFITKISSVSDVKIKFYNTQHDNTKFQLAIKLQETNLRTLKEYLRNTGSVAKLR